MRAEPTLHEVFLNELRPTQLTVGHAEVDLKRREWARLKRKQRERLIAAHCFPAVQGPGRRFYVIDHHHLGIALHQEGVRSVRIVQLADLSDAPVSSFWRIMECEGRAHPFDARGRRRPFDQMPARLWGLTDDPYRSLAGFVRQGGGYAKELEPYTEFLWADFFRPLVSRAQLRLVNGLLAPAVLRRAITLARSPEARYLPGWSGRHGSAERRRRQPDRIQ